MHDLLVDGVELLRAVHANGTAPTELLHAYRHRHQNATAFLVGDPRGATGRVEYDLIVHGAGLGTVSMTWRPDSPLPWSILQADHWASQYVLSVNHRAVTISDALFQLRQYADRQPDLIRMLIDRELIAAAMEGDDTDVSPEERAREAAALRARLGLRTADELNAWLRESGLGDSDFHAIADARVRRDKWQRSLTAARIQERFAERPGDFDQLLVLELTGKPGVRIAVPDTPDAAWPWLLEHAAEIERGQLRWRHAYAVEHELAAGHLVLNRVPARLDARTEQVISDLLLGEWLNAERAKSNITWYWKK